MRDEKIKSHPDLRLYIDRNIPISWNSSLWDIAREPMDQSDVIVLDHAKYPNRSHKRILLDGQKCPHDPYAVIIENGHGVVFAFERTANNKRALENGKPKIISMVGRVSIEVSLKSGVPIEGDGAIGDTKGFRQVLANAIPQDK